MSKYWVSGANSVLLDATFHATGEATAAARAMPGDPTVLMPGENILGSDITNGRVFWLRSFWVFDASAAIVLNLFDASAGADASSGTRRALIQCASGQLTMVDFPSPGLKFATGCVACKDTTDASGCFVPGSIGGAGYEV